MGNFVLGVFSGVLVVLFFEQIGKMVRKRRIRERTKILHDALQQVANSPSAWQSNVFQELAEKALEEAYGIVSIDESDKKE